MLNYVSYGQCFLKRKFFIVLTQVSDLSPLEEKDLNDSQILTRAVARRKGVEMGHRVLIEYVDFIF